MKPTKLFHHAPATQRNREPILKVLQTCLPNPARVLEVASGTGEHAVYLSSNLPQVIHWQPTDIDPTAISSIEAWRQSEQHPKLLPAQHLDVTAPVDIALDYYNALLAINMIHISLGPLPKLMQLAKKLLDDKGILYLYGPFWQADVTPAESNLAFDMSLRQRNALWGIRDLEEVTQLAKTHGLIQQAIITMPANNLSVVYRKE
ncbi:hypothetical protein LH51_06570 [Nitrincola sp. A-D6]|uniref:DUF938 domain-containing protein n=1 Tax=Nitrincola sp. A-D6 TaxID=1545442 RepID=UPI00051FF38E|nr:DUF938 domain-containing protein [Nitrincola sp. A-D6]KGK42566.1 hypothetical protein LH51_06570 [Nitrincola sp. A-D6]